MQTTARILSVSIFALAATTAQAASFSYDYVEGGFGGVDVPKANNADIIYFGGAKTLDKQFGILGAVGIADFGANTDGTVLRGGGFFHKPLQGNLDLIGSVELVYSNWSGGGNTDDLGLAAAGGVRYQLQDDLQLEGKLTLTQVDPFNDGLGAVADARYFLSKEFSAAAGLAANGEYDGVFVNLRYQLK